MEEQCHQGDDARGGRIADPVHGYVDFTEIERHIIDNRVAQRLRHIQQNGLAELVFPEAKTSRLSHSLGSMHVASEFLTSALRNASEGVREETCEAASITVDGVAEPGDAVEAANGLGRDATRVLRAHSNCSSKFASHVQLTEQALRLAAFFHDLGHLPLSHDFEHGLEEYWRLLPQEERDASPLKSLLEQRVGQPKIHERLGHELSKLLFRELFGELKKSPVSEAARISFALAQRILETQEPPDRQPVSLFLAWLHSLVDGELDVDRCDYILRDARTHGFEFATYDLARLLDNLVVNKGVDGSLVTAIRPHGVSAVESFYLSRFRSYQYGVRHHKVAQIGVATRSAVSSILAGSEAVSVPQFKMDLATLGREEVLGKEQRTEFLDRFAMYDDIWWMDLMRNEPPARQDEWLELLCWRKRGPKSLWKRVGDFPRELADWNDKLPPADNLDGQARWAEAENGLRADGVLVVRHYFKPWREGDDGESIFAVMDGVNSTPVTRMSPMIRALRDAWRNDVQVQAFGVSTSLVTKDETIERLEAAFQ